MMTGGSRAPPIEVSAPEKELPATPTQETDPEAELKNAWKEFDPSLNGSITAAQFRQVMATLAENVTDQEVNELINAVDSDNKISCKSFCGVDIR